MRLAPQGPSRRTGVESVSLVASTPPKKGGRTKLVATVLLRHCLSVTLKPAQLSQIRSYLRPVHHRMDHLVELGELYIGRDNKATPDQRLDVEQFDTKGCGKFEHRLKKSYIGPETKLTGLHGETSQPRPSGSRWTR